MKKRIKRRSAVKVVLPLAVFICIGMGFMIVEVSLFQKLVLYLGSPTVSLSILLCSVLIGMGLGSFFGWRMLKDNISDRLGAIGAAVVFAGTLLFVLYPPLFSRLLVYSQAFRSAACFIMIVPFGFLLGIPFPSCIQLLNQEDMKRTIPWMYGVNGAMSVLGSILAVLLSMIFGFTAAFFAGLIPYGVIFVLSRFVPKRGIAL
jgi:predicted membrane-bound spermidine synthase